MNGASGRNASPEWDDLLRTCIHCGLCLNACPTHRLTGDEVESPRGRLGIMRDVLDFGEVRASDELRGPIDRCLGCLACQTVCPSGVDYSHLLTETRERLGPERGLLGRARTALVDEALSRPQLLAILARVGQTIRGWPAARGLLGPLFGPLEALPLRKARWPRSPRRLAASPSRGEVAILRGCAQWVFEPEVLEAMQRLVTVAGFTPVVPADQGCCGALSHHQGSIERSRDLARTNLKAFAGERPVVAASAGCSAFLRQCDHLFPADHPEHRRASELAERSEDLLSWLVREGSGLSFRATSERVVVQNPCHHRHAQSMSSEATTLVARVPGVEIVEAADADLCCGSAGSYQLHQPELARRQRSVKLSALLASSPDRILTGNPGCEFFLEAGIPNGGPVVEHVAVFLARQLEPQSLA